MPEQQQPNPAELALADALNRLANLMAELRADPDLRVEIITAETDLVRLVFSGTPHGGHPQRRAVNGIPGTVIRRVWNERRHNYGSR